MQVSENKLAIVIACDDNFFFHCRNLLASIAKSAPTMAAQDRFCVSPGLSPEHQDELARYGVRYVPLGLDVFPTVLADIVRRHHYTFGQFIRPLFPKIIPGYANYLYMDCDTWVQNDTLVAAVAQAQMFGPDMVVASPMVSHYYPAALNDMTLTRNVQENWLYGTYEVRFARAMAGRSFFSSGVFAISATSPFWDNWFQDILEIAPRVDICNPGFMHFAEQTAFNGVICRTGMVTVLDPLYNFHCNMGGIVRDLTTGLVLSVSAKPVREVCVVHLAAWGSMKEEYVTARLLFEP
ncbi:hypothetical protein C0V82_13555 [Niveispirillum cyanobacteriorum]|uniref:Glycosyl transferase family 8 n=1 Tax=Niveispirillum cyanobacteriorum TaxID=1612173 RepID=A0A2K9NDI4_9PROT|nr:hypothetical protein C0V82_13555 [Niveispirillum cyanobacteriorum]